MIGSGLMKGEGRGSLTQDADRLTLGKTQAAADSEERNK